MKTNGNAEKKRSYAILCYRRMLELFFSAASNVLLHRESNAYHIDLFRLTVTARVTSGSNCWPIFQLQVVGTQVRRTLFALLLEQYTDSDSEAKYKKEMKPSSCFLIPVLRRRLI